MRADRQPAQHVFRARPSPSGRIAACGSASRGREARPAPTGRASARRSGSGPARARSPRAPSRPEIAGLPGGEILGDGGPVGHGRSWPAAWARAGLDRLPRRRRSRARSKPCRARRLGREPGAAADIEHADAARNPVCLRRIRSVIQRMRTGFIRCSGRIGPSGSHHLRRECVEARAPLRPKRSRSGLQPRDNCPASELPALFPLRGPVCVARAWQDAILPDARPRLRVHRASSSLERSCPASS